MVSIDWAHFRVKTTAYFFAKKLKKPGQILYGLIDFKGFRCKYYSNTGKPRSNFLSIMVTDPPASHFQTDFEFS
jgi:hypothetical protein